MRVLFAIVCFMSVFALPATIQARDVRDGHITYTMLYQGGTLSFSHSKVTASLSNDQVVLIQNKSRIAIPAGNIRQISCAREVRRRMGAAVLNAVPRVRLGEIESHYIGVTWTAASKGGTPVRLDAIFKLSKDDYYEVLPLLERMTGLTAVDTSRVPTVVRYEL
jgi:hypothetical protein